MSSRAVRFRDTMPSSPGRTTAARSASVSPVSNGLIRTKNAQSRALRSSSNAATWPRAAAFCAGRDGILEIEDQRVGAARRRLGEFALAVAGHEQERAQLHAGRRIISAARRQYADHFVALVESDVLEGDDPLGRARLAVAQPPDLASPRGSCRRQTPALGSRSPRNRDFRPSCQAWCPAPKGRRQAQA